MFLLNDLFDSLFTRFPAKITQKRPYCFSTASGLFAPLAEHHVHQNGSGDNDADDQPLEEEITFRIDIYARENLLYPINAALHKTIRRNGYQRYGQVQDDYLQDMNIYVKSATYTIKDQLPFPWE